MANPRIKLRRGTTSQVTAYASSAQVGELILDTTTGNLYECITAGSLQLIPGSSVTVGDGTITIQKNSTTVDSFTVNQTANKTINITVPTTASDVGAAASSHTHTESDITDLGSYVPTSRKVNNNALSSDVTLDGSDVAITGYSRASTAANLSVTDTVNEALGKLEKRIYDLETEIDGGVIS